MKSSNGTLMFIAWLEVQLGIEIGFWVWVVYTISFMYYSYMWSIGKIIFKIGKE